MTTYALCPRSLDPFHTVGYYMKWVMPSWTVGMCTFALYAHTLCTRKRPLDLGIQKNFCISILESREGRIFGEIAKLRYLVVCFQWEEKPANRKPAIKMRKRGKFCVVRTFLGRY